MNRIDELRETWEKAYRGLVKDLGNGCTLEDVACMFFELGRRAADESMKVFDKHKKSVEAVRKHYMCDGRQYRCKYYDNCVFGDGEKCLMIVVSAMLMNFSLVICVLYLIKKMNYERRFCNV